MSNKDILEPEYSPCSICNDDGECLANENHPDYVEDIWDDLTYFDCWNYILRRDAKNREGTIIKVKDIIKYKSSLGNDTFYHINKNKTIAELIAYLTKNKLEAVPVVNTFNDNKTDKILGEIGWEEIWRNISNITNDPVSKHMSEPNHDMADSRSLLKVSSALEKKRIFYIYHIEQDKEVFYATLTPKDLLEYYGKIIKPFHYLREIEIIMKSILIKMDVVHLDDKKTIKEYIDIILDEKVYEKLPYNQPRKSLSTLLGSTNQLRNAFFHHRIEKTDNKLLKETWTELKAIFKEVYKK